MRLPRLVSGGMAAAALVLGATACGDSVAPTTITLTPTEVTELFTEMSTALGGAGVSFDVTHAGDPVLLQAPTSTLGTAESINLTAPCPGGGSVGVSGSVNAGTNSVSFDISEQFNSCKTVHFTLRDGPIKFKGSVSSSQTSITVEETVQGNVTVSHNTDGRTGSCGIDFTATLTLDFSSQSHSVTASGTVCGIEATAVVNLQG